MSFSSSQNPAFGSSTTRASLLSRARSRDPAAWSELVELYGPLIAHWCRQYGLDVHATADVIQEVFASVSRKLESYQPVRSSGAFRGWLWTITANKLRDSSRRVRNQTLASGGSTALRQLNQIADLDAVQDEMLAEEPTTECELQKLVAQRISAGPRGIRTALMGDLPTAGNRPSAHSNCSC